MVEEAAVVVDRRGVVDVLVGVDATDDSDWLGCHAGTRSSVKADLTDWGEPTGRATAL